MKKKVCFSILLFITIVSISECTLPSNDKEWYDYLQRRGLDTKVEYSERLGRYQRWGIFAPSNDGFVTEFFQGAGYAYLNTGILLGEFLDSESLKDYFESAKSVRRHWEPDENYTAMSLNSGNIGRFLGTWFVYLWFITIPALCVAAYFMFKKAKKYYGIARLKLSSAKEQSNLNKVVALEELESGNLDKLAWAKALESADGDEAKAKARYIKFRSQTENKIK